MKKLLFGLFVAVVLSGAYSCESSLGDSLKDEQGNPSTDLSSNGSSNCYIVSEKGFYKLRTVQGNSSNSVGKVASADVLWKTFGTDVVPSVGSLISNIAYADGYIYFKASDKKGNASIAAKDAEGKILWSWHIWMTDRPADHVYNNNAGIMMDRNLGATSANPGDVAALGLFYQWGRKDPFLGRSSILGSVIAESTITWPSVVDSDVSKGTIAYATEHPTTFIVNKYGDWYYTENSEVENTRWQSVKTVYDPCPPGYRVPDGGSYGIWTIAFGGTTYLRMDPDLDNNGFNLGSIASENNLTETSPICWYPLAGSLWFDDGTRVSGGGSLSISGDTTGEYWSCSPYYDSAYGLTLYRGLYKGAIEMGINEGGPNRYYGFSVRCARE